MLELKRLCIYLALGLLIIGLIGCGEVETRARMLPDGSKAIVDATGKILSGGKAQALEGYIYGEQGERYINQAIGVWYVVENGYKIIPPEQYFDPDKLVGLDGINIADRLDNVWELSEIREITIQPGDTLVDIINPYFMNEHFRMNYEWYAKQVLELNNITDPHYIRAGDTIKYQFLSTRDPNSGSFRP